jgi:TonB-dependent starch-binding outer membrane protein SusC
MRRRALLFLVVLVLGSIPVMAQQWYEATIIDQEDHVPVAYANVGIPGSETGTNSDSLGRFTLLVPADAKDKMLSISMIGYEEYKVKVADVFNQKTISLKKSRQALAEVVIKPAKLTSAILGNDVVCKSEGAGLPLPYLFEKKKKGVVVKWIH